MFHQLLVHPAHRLQHHELNKQFSNGILFSVPSRRMVMGTHKTIFVLSLLLFNIVQAAKKGPKKCYRDEGCCFKAEGCNLIIPLILNNSQATYEICTACEPYCSEPEQKPLLLSIKFDIVGVKYLPRIGGPFSYYQIQME